MFSLVYFVFNRPRLTRKSFSAIRKAKPSNLFVVADGPRKDFPEDIKLCSKVRNIVEKVDWSCDVYRNYAKKNMGLKDRVSSGLDWVFSKVDQAIILEDDCVPHPDFFTFCDHMLDYYADDERVWVITGNNFQRGQSRGVGSYYFSKYNHCWGWATWRRAWRHYQGDIPFWKEWKHTSDWSEKNPDPVERRYWERIFDDVSRGRIDSWAYPWTASVWFDGGLTATPNSNLVTNIGFGHEGTHTKKINKNSHVPLEPLGPLIHPEKVIQNVEADRFVFNNHFGGKNLRYPRKFIFLIKSLIKFFLKK